MAETLGDKGGDNDKDSPNYKLRVGLSLVAASSAVIGALAAHVTDKDSQQGISQSRAREIAQEAVIAQRNAALLADSYSQRLTEATHPIGKITPVVMQYLNGKIEVMTPPGAHKGGPPETYKDAILLSLATPNVKPDKAGNFLIGAWIGIENSSPNGVSIEPVPYAIDGSMHFTANNPNDPGSYIGSAGVYPQSYGTGTTTAGWTLFAENLQGNFDPKNTDGSPVQPGRVEQQQ